jgi:hypothetical protein
MAIASPRVRADVVELTEFRDLVTRYAVRGVPKTVINERLYFDGVLPEPDVLAAVLEASRRASEEEST